MSVDSKTKAWADKRPKKLVDSKVILKSSKGNILLVKPNYKPTWQFPGGGVEANESPEDAAIREVKEELGLQLSVQDLKLVGLAFREDIDDLYTVFESRLVLNEDEQFHVQSSEHDDYRFVLPEEVALLLSDYYVDFWKTYLSSFGE